MNYPQPKNQTDIKSVLGLAGYYWHRRFLSNFVKISKPLTKLLQKGETFIVDTECTPWRIKQALTSTPILMYLNFDESFVLTSDASTFAISSVLSQGPIRKDFPILSTLLFSIKDPGSRLARWQLKMEEYDYEIVFRSEKINKHAVARSQIKTNQIKDCISFQSKAKLTPFKVLPSNRLRRKTKPILQMKSKTTQMN